MGLGGKASWRKYIIKQVKRAKAIGLEASNSLAVLLKDLNFHGTKICTMDRNKLEHHILLFTVENSIKNNLSLNV